MTCSREEKDYNKQDGQYYAYFYNRSKPTSRDSRERDVKGKQRTDGIVRVARRLGRLAGSLLEMVSQTVRVEVGLDAPGFGALVRFVGGVGVAT